LRGIPAFLTVPRRSAWHGPRPVSIPGHASLMTPYGLPVRQARRRQPCHWAIWAKTMKAEAMLTQMQNNGKKNRTQRSQLTPAMASVAMK
jgi:hypothetical protein